MTDHAFRKTASILALTLMLAGCGGAQNQAATIDEKVAAAEKAAERAEKAQKSVEEALRAMAGGNSASVSYDEAVNELDESKSRSDDDSETASSGETRINSDGVEELATPPG